MVHRIHCAVDYRHPGWLRLDRNPVASCHPDLLLPVGCHFDRAASYHPDLVAVANCRPDRAVAASYRPDQGADARLRPDQGSVANYRPVSEVDIGSGRRLLLAVVEPVRVQLPEVVMGKGLVLEVVPVRGLVLDRGRVRGRELQQVLVEPQLLEFELSWQVV